MRAVGLVPDDYSWSTYGLPVPAPPPAPAVDYSNISQLSFNRLGVGAGTDGHFAIGGFSDAVHPKLEPPAHMQFPPPPMYPQANIHGVNVVSSADLGQQLPMYQQDAGGVTDGLRSEVAYDLSHRWTNRSEAESTDILTNMRVSRSCVKPPRPERLCQHALDAEVRFFGIDGAIAVRHLQSFLPVGANGQHEQDKPGDWLVVAFDREVFSIRGKTRRKSPQATGPRGVVEVALSRLSFGNLPFSDAIFANHQPSSVQMAQHGNMFLPVWAMQSLHDTLLGDQGMMAMVPKDPFEQLLAVMRYETAGQQSPDVYCGKHAYFGALVDREIYNQAPPLSQNIARMVWSMKPEQQYPTFTSFAVMWVWWSLFRWMLFPSEETYRELPELIRPTAWQIFSRHPLVFDLVVSPALRDFVCMKGVVDTSWLTDACVTICCEWPHDPATAFVWDPHTRRQDLSEICKVCWFSTKAHTAAYFKLQYHVQNPANWSLGPSARKFFEEDLNSYIRIRNGTT